MSVYTLIIWEEIPEKTTLYLVPNEVADKYTQLLEAAHGTYLNSDEENEGLRFLNNALCENREWCSDKETACIFARYKQQVRGHTMPLKASITRVILSGFVM